MPVHLPFEVRLTASVQLSPSVRKLELARVDGQPIFFAPGQWVNLFLPLGQGEEKRAYSIASAPHPDGSSRIELAVTRVPDGPGSEFLHAAPIGQQIRAAGPFGTFTRPAEDRTPAVFVATGTGLAPLRSMLLAASQESAPPPMLLLFGARRQSEILFRHEFDALARRSGRFRYEVTLSQPDEGWTGRRGYVQDHLAELWQNFAPSEASAYVCGLDKMVTVVRDLLRNDLGAERKRVRTERYD